MKKNPLLLAALTLALSLFTTSALAQGGPGGPGMDGAIAKLFGDNKAFTTTVEFHTTLPSGAEMTMPGKMAFLDGKTRFEMDMADMKGGGLPPGAVAQMKQMGMDRMATLGLPDKKQAYIIYPNLKAYVPAPAGAGAITSAADYKSEATKLGAETVDGHDCVKNKVVVTGPDGVPHESTVWNAKDLNQFPVKIQMAPAQGMNAVMLFKDVKLSKPDAAQFDLPAGYTKYDDMTGLMMSRMKAAPPQ